MESLLLKKVWLYSRVSNKHAARFINFLKKIQPARPYYILPVLLISEIFPACTFFSLLIFGKFHPARPYSILHVLLISEIFQPARLFHPTRLFDTLEYVLK